eukprot:5058042-Amphidinium_carterae.1
MLLLLHAVRYFRRYCKNGSCWRSSCGYGCGEGHTGVAVATCAVRAPFCEPELELTGCVREHPCFIPED